MKIHNMDAFDLSEKRVLIREDFNVPIEAGRITNDARLIAALPTIKKALAAKAKILLMSHLGRPEEGHYQHEFSLKPIADYLSNALNETVPVIQNWQALADHNPHRICLLENVRFNAGEKKNDSDLAKKMASLCDIFVMDAFGTAHRAQASTYGVAEFAPIACAGPLLTAELSALGQATENPNHPVIAIVGGSKVSTKLAVLESLAKVVDQLIVGGGIANTFLAASGFNIGKSLFEPDLIDTSKAILQQTQVPLPTDVVVAKEFSTHAAATIKHIDEIDDDDMILDIGPDSAQILVNHINKAKTIIWNGPVGVFEIEQFSKGTQQIAQAIADSDAFSLAGGGDTIAAIEKYHLANKISYISTGGGAFLEFIEGKTLPAVAILHQRTQR